ncbi:MAG TPA: DUF1499 domain-containing protein [Candidatus Limnocylindria bacterium]|nr:DUF1499 domain-containing protein [Candidatus Limnocylindria bacterium]
MLAGVALAWLRLVPALAGFALFALGGLVCLVASLAALVGLLRGRSVAPGGVVALAGAAVLIAAALPGMGVPRINDFTTDLADPPAFVAAAALAPNVGRSMDYPPAFAAEQRSCCADLRPARLSAPPAEAFARVQAVASAMPAWTVIASDPATGRLEAVVTTRVFGFQDDVAIRVRPAPDGGSVVDVRSKSRDGKGDLGANANRIRAFVARLEERA